MKSLNSYFIIGLLALSSIAVMGQGGASPVAEVIRNNTQIKGNKLSIDFDIKINGQIRSKQGLILTPILQNGHVSELFPVVIVNGRDRDISYHRTISEQPDQTASQKPYKVVKIKRHGSRVVTYRAELPLKAWMVGSVLWIRDDMQSCLVVQQDIARQMVSRQIAFGDNVLPLALTLVWPTPQDHTDSLCATIFFPENVTTIDANYMGNERSLEKIYDLLINPVNYITSVEVVGAASPEGAYRANETLSENRAKTMAAFLENNYHIVPKIDSVSWVGEDWVSMSKDVKNSTMTNKWQILQIIDQVADPELRLQHIEQVEGLGGYQAIKDDIFPLLRRADFKIYYRIDQMKLEKARRLIFTQPDSLTYQDMMMVANSYPRGSLEFNSAILIAAEQYPLNDAANLNAGSVMLDKRNTEEAEKYFNKIQTWSNSWYNNVGVMYLLEGDYTKAVKCLDQAAQACSAQAIENLALINTTSEAIK